MLRKSGILCVIVIGMVVCDWLALIPGWWWITFIVGFLSSVMIPKGRRMFVLSFCAGGLGWSLPLLILAFHAPLLKVARAVEGIIGVSNTDGWLIVMLTILLGGILSLLGTWVSVVGRQAMTILKQRPLSMLRE